MKIQVEIPDNIAAQLKAENKNLFVFVDTIVVAVKQVGRPWVVKTTLCSMCGSCCNKAHTWNMNLPIKDGECVLLLDHPNQEGKKICGWKGNRPFSCCIGSPRLEPNCTLTWEYAQKGECR